MPPKLYDTSADRTSVSLHDQYLQMVDFEERWKHDKRSNEREVREYEKKKAERDKFLEESFDEFWEATLEHPQISGEPFKKIDRPSDKEGLKKYKKDLHHLWTTLGKPLIRLSSGNMPKFHGGTWYSGGRYGYDYIEKREIGKPASKMPYPWSDEFLDINPKTSTMSDMLYGPLIYGPDWYESAEGRMDEININPNFKRLINYHFLEELGHQMQGRKLYGSDLSNWRNFEDRQYAKISKKTSTYDDPRSKEYQAHTTYWDLIKRASLGEGSALDKIKNLDYEDPLTHGWYSILETNRKKRN